MPAGDAARGFPKVASEIQGALSQSRSGLQNVAEELTESEKQNAKRAQLQSLVQRAKQAQDAAECDVRTRDARGPGRQKPGKRMAISLDGV